MNEMSVSVEGPLLTNCFGCVAHDVNALVQLSLKEVVNKNQKNLPGENQQPDNISDEVVNTVEHIEAEEHDISLRSR